MWRYSSTHSCRHQMEVKCNLHVSAALLTVPIEYNGSQCLCFTWQEISPVLLGIEHRFLSFLVRTTATGLSPLCIGVIRYWANSHNARKFQLIFSTYSNKVCVTWFRAELYLDVCNENFADKMLLLYMQGDRCFMGQRELAWSTRPSMARLGLAPRASAGRATWFILHTHTGS